MRILHSWKILLRIRNLTKNTHVIKMKFTTFSSLSDAVSAIEIMDPKMDSGMEKPDLTLGLENSLKVNQFTLIFM